MKNYWPVSLRRTCANSFEKVMFNSLFRYEVDIRFSQAFNKMILRRSIIIDNAQDV